MKRFFSDSGSRWVGGLALLLVYAWSIPVMAESKHKANEAPVLPEGVLQDCPDCPQVNLIPSGRFMMGSQAKDPEIVALSGEAQPWWVSIDHAFAMGRTEVTRAQYAAFVRATQRVSIGDCRVLGPNGFTRKTENNWENPGFHRDNQPDDPVVCVSWDDAHAYTDWLTSVTGHRYRLPSETEWEYAARSGTTGTRFYANDDSDEMSLVSNACEYANVYDYTADQALHLNVPHARCTDSSAELSPVARYKPNGFDLFDMLGNAREWLEDCYTASYVGRPANGMPWVWGGCAQRGVRGGSYATRPSETRSAYRGHEVQAMRQNDLGFRVVRELD
jgi:formylglycine-generating enzyme required for sulfatase activity